MKGWCIKDEFGSLMISHINSAGFLVKNSFEYMQNDKWENLEKKGYSLVQVEIKEIGEDCE